jgi:hypothetical protein
VTRPRIAQTLGNALPATRDLDELGSVLLSASGTIPGSRLKLVGTGIREIDKLNHLYSGLDRIDQQLTT